MLENSFALEAVGQTYKDFIITKYLQLPELQSALIELVHEPSGARILHIANDDPENLFCLSFQTLPSSSNGVAHILEHTVLCGSDKFPVKDPFFAMTRRSLNTYMNALTGQDFTCYPASSQVEKDFYNLLSVYLDAVFHPELKHVSFLQEGHRLEFKDPKDKEGPIQFQGVVYNEMKGAMSSIESRLWEALIKHLTPDLPYAYNSGGSPKEIPSLTYEGLKEFHQEFYHPSRCLFFFYGNLSLAKHLDALEETLSGVEKVSPLPPLPKQKRFDVPVKVTEHYPIAAGESLEKKTQIAFAWLTSSVFDQTEILALSLIESMLADTDASPLTKALLKSGLCTQVDSALDTEMSEVPWLIICKGAEGKDADKIEKLLFDTLKNVTFSKEEIEASMHQLEFQRTEIGAEGVPFGLSLFFRSALIQQHGCEPEMGLLIHTLFSDLRSRVQDPSYLPNLLQKLIINNPHFVRLTLKPDPELALEEAKEEQEVLSQIRTKLDPSEKEMILNQMQMLKEHQEEVEHQSLECLPKVTLKDVPLETRDFPLVQNGNVFYHNCFTNQILYADLIFDLPEIQEEELPMVSLLSRIITELGSGERNYEETLAYQQSYIGSFDAAVSLHVTRDDPNLCLPTFSLRGKALERNAGKLFQLFMDTVNQVDFSDVERIREFLHQHATELADRLPRAAMSYAIQTSLSGKSIPSHLYNQWHGLPYFQSVMNWIKSFDDNFIEALKALFEKVVGASAYQLVIGCDQDQYNELEKMKFYDLKMPNREASPWTGNYPMEAVESQARIIAAPIAFNSLGLKTINSTDPLSPALLISTELMENLILHKEIREKGGAYGSGATYTPSTGNFNFYSYRDPHVARTVSVFDQAIQKIKAKEFNERELEEAKLGVIQALDAPVAPGNRALLAYSWLRQGRTLEARTEFRQKVLSATAEEIAESLEKHLTGLEGTLVSFLGKELLEKEEKLLKSPLKVIPI